MMKPTFCSVLTLAVVLGAGGCCSSRRSQGHQTQAAGEANQQNAAPKASVVNVPSEGSSRLANELVGWGREEYREGKFELAERDLQKAMEIDQGNLQAWYYLKLVKEGIRRNSGPKSGGLWYPTLPPRRVGQ
jgi:hypothetical protein